MLGAIILSANLATETQEIESCQLKFRHSKERISKTYQLEIHLLSCLEKMSRLQNRKLKRLRKEQGKKRLTMLQCSRKRMRDRIISSKKFNSLRTIESQTIKNTCMTSWMKSHTKERSLHSLQCNPSQVSENLKKQGASPTRMTRQRKTLILETLTVRPEMLLGLSSWKSSMKGQLGHSSYFIESIIQIVNIVAMGQIIMIAR